MVVHLQQCLMEHVDELIILASEQISKSVILLEMLSSIFFSFFSKGESMISKSLSIQAK
jgi:hypothetical protein